MGQKGRLEGKVAIITGAANGIGRATALLFAEQGACLALSDIDEKGLKDTGDHAAKINGDNVLCRTVDVAVEEQVKGFIEETLKTYSQVDILCNNAGISGLIPPLEEQTSEEWHNIFDINVMGPVYAVKYIIKHMKERGSGSIINIASVAGIRSGAGGNAYSASKAALINFTQTSACEVGEFNVRINAICPGLIETAMTQPFFDYARSSGIEERLGNKCELKRYAKPKEVASAILFLASDEASYITGQALPVDGGISASLSLPGRKI